MKKVNLSKDYLIKNHILLKKSTKQIAEENCCAQSTVNSWLRTYGIPRNGLQIKDLSGKKFGKWTVISRGPNEKSGAVKWNVACSCGNTSCVLTHTLTRGTSSKCRKCCLPSKKDNPFWTGYGDISGTIWSRLKYGSNRRKKGKFPINIDIKYAWRLYKKQDGKCALSGVSIKFGSYDLKEETTASLDRIDSSRGYVKGNVQWVHKTVNKMKQDLEQDVFLSFCKTISENV